MNFANEWGLLGLAALVIPIIIHLIKLRRPQRQFFSNTAFIKQVELVTTQQRKIRELLLLIIRILAVGMLALFFCQPYIPINGKSGSDGHVGRRVWVDNSFSMQQRIADAGTLFEYAVSEARKLGMSAARNEKIGLTNNGNALLTPSVFQTKLNELRLGTGIFSTKNNLNSIVQEQPYYVFSDFQKKEFGPKWIDHIGARLNVTLVPFAAQSASNVYVDSLWLEDAFVRVRTNVTMFIRLRNGGSSAVIDCPVKVFLGARQVAAFRVAVGVEQTTTFMVQVQVNDEAAAEGRVVTEDAPVTFDNIYHFVLQPAAAIRVVEIGGEPVTQYLYGNEPLFKYSFAKTGRVDYRALRVANAVLLHEIDDVDAGLRDGLVALLQRGGSVMVVPSAKPSGHASYQRLFKELGLGAVQWVDTGAMPELQEVAIPSAQEPFFREVFGAQQRGVTMPRAAPVLRWSRTGTDVLRFRDGESYLAKFPSGRGNVYVFSAPFSKEYSDVLAHALFVPVMYRIAMLSFRNEQLPAYRLSQGNVTLRLPADNALGGGTDGPGLGFRLVKDSSTLLPAQRLIGQEVVLELPAGMTTPGFYRVQQRGKLLTTLAFNQDKRESELAAYSAAELRAMIGTNRPNIRVVEPGTGGLGLSKLQEEQSGRPLWRYFLVLTLVCLLAEALLVRFGSRRKTAAIVSVGG